jgi:probable rRNA maturation factor
MIKIDISEDYDPLPNFHSERISDCTTSILNNHKINEGCINFIIVTDDFLRKLKNIYFNMDVFTDVMAFNLEEEGEDLDGEIYISWDRILDNSEKLEIDSELEFKRILIHGVLHLIGYDDQTKNEKSQMTNLENDYISKFPEQFYS